MRFDLELLQALKKGGWKVKIHDWERLEPPHITIYRRRLKWRLSLRDRSFLDRGDKWSEIDKEVRETIEANWELLQAEWDRIHPDNPIRGQHDDNDNDQ